LKILLIGADGQLGTDIQKVIKSPELIPLTISDIDITDKKSVDIIFEKYKPDIAINTAGYSQVDKSEEDDISAFTLNAFAVKNLCLACKRHGTQLMHISSDYVFNGRTNKPYKETDIPSPGTVYGMSKLTGEFYVKELLDKYYIIRTCGLYGVRGCMGKGGGNFVENMINASKEKPVIRVVGDQIVAPTYTHDLAEKLALLVRTGRYGIYHITNSGKCSWYDFAKKIFELTKISVRLEKASTAEFHSKANRPAFSVLENKNMQKAGIGGMRSWDKALEAYLIETKQLTP
jgi:dTDP-4-dehydrorhamnose reductase